MTERVLRRYDLMPEVVHAATERRLAGDWRGACAAARIHIHPSLDGPGLDGPGLDGPGLDGAATPDGPAALAEDLRHLAPELIRWHLLDTDLAPVTAMAPLAWYTLNGRRVALVAQTTWNTSQPAPIMLTLTETPTDARWISRWLWDARHADGLRAHLGGADRVPFFDRHGRTVTDLPTALPAAEPPDDDPAAWVEWESRRLVEDPVGAWRRAGIEPDANARDVFTTRPETVAPLWPHRVLPAAEILFGGGVQTVAVSRATRAGVDLTLTRRPGAAPTLGVESPHRVWRMPRIPARIVHRPWYVDALRTGALAPAALPPLVRTAMFPDRPDEPYTPAPGVRVPERVHVQCHARHYVGWRDGELRLLSHDDPEQERRERVLNALGGPIAGCFRVERAWTQRTGPLPRALRVVARHMYLAARYGDVAELTRLLDAGVDPRGVRGPQRASLLHVADQIGDPALIRRLLAAGLDPNQRDSHGNLPLAGVPDVPDWLRALLR